MTDFRALCEELIDELQEYVDADLPVDGEALAKTELLVIRARAALAEQPVGPTDEELDTTARAAEIQYMKEYGGLIASTPDGIYAQLQAQRLAGLRAVAARWGQP
jgi:hypothetical protein